MNQITIVPLSTLAEWEQFILPPTHPLATWNDWNRFYESHAQVVYTLTKHDSVFSQVFCPDYTFNDNETLAYFDMSPDTPVIRAPLSKVVSPWLPHWLRIGLQNRWIKRASDPQFTARNFVTCESVDRLKRYFTEALWGLGQAFYVEDICFINQIDGGDEWLVIRREVAFDSFTTRAFIADNTFDDVWERIKQATDEQLKTLTY